MRCKRLREIPQLLDEEAAKKRHSAADILLRENI
jgi:hypothetical protein